MSVVERRLAGFIARFFPEVAELGGTVLGELRARLPHANLLVYDNYNALAEPPLDPGHAGRLVIKSISAKQRPHRPVA